MTTFPPQRGDRAPSCNRCGDQLGRHRWLATTSKTGRLYKGVLAEFWLCDGCVQILRSWFCNGRQKHRRPVPVTTPETPVFELVASVSPLPTSLADSRPIRRLEGGVK